MTAPDLTNSKFWIVVPQAGTNYIYNPRLDKPQGLTGYTVVNGTQALSDTYKRWGVYSIEVTPTASVASSVHYDGVPIATGVAYTFSVYVKGVAGQAMRIVITNSAGTAKQTTQFTASGEWQRVEVTHTGTETASTYECWVTRDSVASTAKFYIDGFQFEQASKATTFIHGDAGDGYSWAGLPRVSASVRSDRTRAGGSLLCINDYAKILQVFGFGMGQFEQIMYPMSNGGDYYQQHLRRSRNVGFLLAYWGDNQGDMQRNRNTILEAVRPDYLDNQPVKIIYQGFDDLGNEATNPLEITCVLQPSHVDTPSLPVFQKDTLMFTVPSGHFDGAYEEGAELNLYEEIAVDYAIYKDSVTGRWYSLGLNNLEYITCPLIEISTGLVVISKALYLYEYRGADSVINLFNNYYYLQPFEYWRRLYEMPNGDIIAGGTFINLESNAGIDYIVKLTRSAPQIVQLGTALDNAVYAIALSKEGVLYIGGAFTTAGGDTNCNYIAYYDTLTSDWKPLSTGLNGGVSDLLVDGDRLYICGGFTNAGGSGANYLTYWDGTSFNKIGTTQLSSSVSRMAIDKQGNLVVGGTFTNAGGNIDADYIAMWDGSKWNSLGNGLNDAVKSISITEDNTIIVGGKFSIAGNAVNVKGVAKYHNGAWKNIDIDLPTSYSQEILYTLVTKNGGIYIAGDFSTHDTSINAIACATHDILNTGNANVYPKFVITGPGVMGSISNFRTKKTVQFEGLTLQAGESITINLDPSNLYMTSSWEGRGNVLRYVAAGSDYGNFSLEPGENYINIYMPSGTDANSGGYMTYTPRFWNIEGAIYE